MGVKEFFIVLAIGLCRVEAEAINRSKITFDKIKYGKTRYIWQNRPGFKLLAFNIVLCWKKVPIAKKII